VTAWLLRWLRRAGLDWPQLAEEARTAAAERARIVVIGDGEST
jgi:hypothetical protein